MFSENWCSESQINHVKNLLNEVLDQNGLFIELGCWTGFSTCHIMNYIYPTKLIVVDHFFGNKEESKVEGRRHITEDILDNRDIYGEFINNVNSLTRGNYILYKQDHYEFLRNLKSPISFVYIDGSHDYYSVKMQLELIMPLLMKGSLVCLDDYWSTYKSEALHGGVFKAVNELLTNFRTTDNMCYYFHKGNHHLKTNGQLYYNSSEEEED